MRGWSSRQVWGQSLLWAQVAVLGCVLLYPVWLTVRGGFASGDSDWTLEHFGLILRDPVLREGFANAMLIAVFTTLVSIGIGVPLAFASARYQFPFKKLWSAAVLLPLILPPFVGAIGFRAIAGRQGLINTLLGTEFDVIGQWKLTGVVIVEALHLFPIIYLNTSAALANLDPALDEAADNLGSGPLRRLFRVTLPLIRPGIFAGATIVFIWSFTELGTPLIFEFYKVMPVQIFEKISQLEAAGQPYALTLVMLVSALLFYLVGKVLFGRQAHAMYSKASRASSERTVSPLAGILIAGAFAIVSLAAALPHIGVLVTGFAVPGSWYGSLLPRHATLEHYATALTDQVSSGAIVNSFIYSVLAVIVCIVLGLLAAYTLVRLRPRGRGVLDTLTMLPLAVPGIVLAFGYVAMTLRWPFEGGPLEGLVSVFGGEPNPVPLLVVAYAVRRLPYMVRSAAAGLEQTSGELEEAAMSLGASRLVAVRRVIVPLILANLIAGSLLVFSFSMLEVSDSLILAQQARHYPVTRAIYAFMNRLGDGPYVASAMGTWAMALLAVTLVGASLMLGRKMGSIFRV